MVSLSPRILLLLALLAAWALVRADREPHVHSIEKRQVNAVARTEGKRYIGALARSGDFNSFVRPTWNKKLYYALPSETEEYHYDKRYVGALAKTGDLRFAKQQDDKRDEVDSLIEELMTAEELRRLRLETLREELFREREEQEQDDEDGQSGEKRSMSSLARNGNMPFRPEGKKSVGTLARAGYLKPASHDFGNYDSEAFGKRALYSLAKNGDMPTFKSEGKRGGISSLARVGFPHSKRSVDNQLEDLMSEVYGVDENQKIVDSNAGNFNFPAAGGKRNLGSFVKNGGLSGMTYLSKKDTFDDVDDEDRVEEVKLTPPDGEKRYIASLMRDDNIPRNIARYGKKYIGAMARNWDLPNSYRFGKRDEDDDDFDDLDIDEISKRYVAALLRQGRLPLGVDPLQDHSTHEAIPNDDVELKEPSGSEEQKRHIGSLKGLAMRRKKSISLETTSAELKKPGPEQKGEDTSHRAKREAFYSMPEPSGEFSMPVLQNSGIPDYEEIVGKFSEEASSPLNKRYFAVRGGGKMPGGRLSTIGRSRSRNENSGRRRH